MSDTPMDVSYNATVTNPTPASPSSNINPGVGMKKPQYMLNQSRPTGAGIHNKPGVDIWSGSAFGKALENEIMPTSTYQGCECPTCLELNVDCGDCPVCANPIPETDSEVAMAMYDSSIGKADPCWEGYVQRGMKPGANGNPVPNCIPVAKMDNPIVEGDFVIAMTTEGPVVGQVEHVMLEGGTYGQPGNPYAVESTPENPAVAVRMLEEEDGVYYYTPYSIGALMSDIARIDIPNKVIVNREKDKSLFAEFGKDYTKETLTDRLFR